MWQYTQSWTSNQCVWRGTAKPDTGFTRTQHAARPTSSSCRRGHASQSSDNCKRARASRRPEGLRSLASYWSRSGPGQRYVIRRKTANFNQLPHWSPQARRRWDIWTASALVLLNLLSCRRWETVPTIPPKTSVIRYPFRLACLVYRASSCCCFRKKR